MVPRRRWLLAFYDKSCHSLDILWPPRPHPLYLRRLRQITSAPKSQQAYHKMLERVLVACSSFLLISSYSFCYALILGLSAWSACLRHIFLSGVLFVENICAYWTIMAGCNVVVDLGVILFAKPSF